MDAELQELMQQVVNGSEDAARTLFDKYRDYLLFVIRQRMHQNLRKRFDSTDIAQDVWASFFSEPLENRGFETREQLIAFLTTLAKNKLNDAQTQNTAWRRNVNREISMDDSHRFDKTALPAPDATPSQIVMSKEEWTRFLSTQPPVYRAIYMMMRDGKTHVEIAAELGINDRLIRRVMNRLTPEAAT